VCTVFDVQTFVKCFGTNVFCTVPLQTFLCTVFVRFSMFSYGFFDVQTLVKCFGTNVFVQCLYKHFRVQFSYDYRCFRTFFRDNCTFFRLFCTAWTSGWTWFYFFYCFQKLGACKRTLAALVNSTCTSFKLVKPILIVSMLMQNHTPRVAGALSRPPAACRPHPRLWTRRGTREFDPRRPAHQIRPRSAFYSSWELTGVSKLLVSEKY
jgi:uncharacterized protein YqgQ